MLIKEPTSFHDSLTPLVYFNYFVGMAVHQPSNLSNTVYFRVKLYTIIIILTNWTMTYIGLTELGDFKQFRDTLPAALMMYRVLMYTNSCLAVTSPFLLWLQRKVLLDCLRQMQILDDTFQFALGARNDYRKQYVRLICRVIAIVIVMALVGICNSLWLDLDKKTLLSKIAIVITVHYPIIVLLVLDLNFCTFVGYLQTKFRDLNDAVLGLTEKQAASYSGKKVLAIPRKVLKVIPGCHVKNMKAESFINDHHYLLREIRKSDLELRKLSRKINLAFGIQNLLSMGISFAVVTGMLYTTYSAFSWKSLMASTFMRVVPSVTWSIIYVFKIWVINHSCCSLGNETERGGDVIYELLETRVDKELQQEIQGFAVQMLQNPVRFNACGFFTLDYTFVQGVIGSITTYLVILIQMAPVPESPTSNTALA